MSTQAAAARLDADQRKVADLRAGTFLVLAGAGAGKTNSLTVRVANLIESGIHPSNILVLTFTNKAAKEMTTRIKKLVSKNADGLWTGTFHSVAARLLRQVAMELGYASNRFTIMDEDDAESIIRHLSKEHKELKAKKVTAGDIKSAISYCINTQQDLKAYLDFDEELYEVANEIVAVAKGYHATKFRRNAMDFDDLLINFNRALAEIPHFRKRMQEEFQYVMVDEAQDNNAIQWDIVEAIVEGHRNLMVIGDADQSIYRFRGASIEHFLAIPQRYPDCVRFDLRNNYRSTDPIVVLANASIRKNQNRFDRESVAVEPVGATPVVRQFRDPYAEAKAVAGLISEQAKTTELKEIAVLFRSAFVSLRLQMELARHRIPFTLRGGQSFFAKAHVKDALSWFRLFLNPHDKAAWERAMCKFPGIGKATFEKNWDAMEPDPLNQVLLIKGKGKGFDAFVAVYKKFEAARKENMEAAAAVATGDWLVASIWKEHPDDAGDRMEDLGQLRELIAEYQDLEAMMEDFALMTGEEKKKEKNGIILSTIHASKGLEWQHVHLLSANDGVLPSSRAETSDDVEEERRLFYVAVTRAARTLSISYTDMVLNWSNELSPGRASRFLAELPRDLFIHLAA